ENNYRFGSTVEELQEISSTYDPLYYYHQNPDIKDAVDSLISGELKDDNSYMLLDIYNELVDKQDGSRGDQYYLLKDFESYRQAHEDINRDYRDKETWAKKSLINIENSGFFSSDRTIREYAKDIWKLI